MVSLGLLEVGFCRIKPVTPDFAIVVITKETVRRPVFRAELASAPALIAIEQLVWERD